MQWLEQGASAFTADDLVAAGKALFGKSVGELEHGEALQLPSWLLVAARCSSDVALAAHRHKALL